MTAIRYDFNNGMIATIGVVGTCLVFTIVFAVQGWFYRMDQRSFDKNNARVPISVVQYNADQAEKLSTYSWVDRDKNVVRIPVERAKYTVLKEYSR